MKLRPGGKPAILLLRLWHRQAYGERSGQHARTRAVERLELLGYVTVDGTTVTLTNAGRLTARTLEAGS